MKKMMPIPAGSLFTISTGSYSDYYVHGVFRALETLDVEALQKQWFKLHPEQNERYEFDSTAFLGWVATEGKIEPVECFEWYLCDYRSPNEMEVSIMSGKD